MIRHKSSIGHTIIICLLTLIVINTARAQNNIVPTAQDDKAITQQKVRVFIPVLSNDRGQDLTITETSTPAHGTIELFRRALYYTPTAGFTGEDSFSYTISDKDGTTASAQVFVTVENISPTTRNDRFFTFQGETATLTPLKNDYDRGGDTQLTIISAGPAARGIATISNDGQTILYTPNPGWRGNDRFAYIIADPHNGQSRQAYINVEVRNSSPIATDDTVSLSQAESVLISPLDNDTDLDGDTLQLINISQPPQNGSFKIIMGRYIRYTPKASFVGLDELIYIIKDTKNKISTAKIIITVWPKAPTPRDDSASTKQNTAILLDVLRNDTFYNGAHLTITNVTTPDNGTAIISEDGRYITFTPSDGFAGDAQFDYTVTDVLGAQGTARVTITVRNKPPQANVDIFYTVQNVPVIVDILANDADVPGDNVILFSIERARNGIALLQAGGEVLFIPDNHFVGQADFFYTIKDMYGRIASARAVIMVENIAPIAEDDIAETGVNIPVKIEPTLNDSDRGGDNLRIANIRNVNGGTAIIEMGRKKVTFTPNDGFAGEATFEYILVDGKGGRDIGRVTVQVVNDNPIAQDDLATTRQAQSLYINLARNDSDINGHNVLIYSVEQPQNGIVSIHRSRKSVFYTPNKGFAGDDRFSYTVEDGYGGMATAIVTVKVTNIPPSAQNDKAFTTQLNPVTIDVLANDFDAGGDESFAVIAVTDPSRGQTQIDDGGISVTYMPDANWRGRDSFSYTIRDEYGDISSARVHVTVINSAPVAANDYTTLPMNHSILIHVLHNDSDLDSDAIYLQGIVRYPNNGRLRIFGDKVRYIPDEDFVGTDSFDYIVADAQGLTNSATVFVTVINPNEEPPTDNPPSNDEPPQDDDHNNPPSNDEPPQDDDHNNPPSKNDEPDNPPPPPTCTDPNPDRDLRNSNTGLHRPAHPPTVTGTITNTSDACAYEVGIASYRMFSWNTNTQAYIGSQTAIIQPGETLHFSAAAAECATQVDLFYGSVIYSFAGGVRYNNRLLDAVIPNWDKMCPSEEPSTQETPTEETTTEETTNEEQPPLQTHETTEPSLDEICEAQASETDCNDTSRDNDDETNKQIDETTTTEPSTEGQSVNDISQQSEDEQPPAVEETTNNTTEPVVEEIETSSEEVATEEGENPQTEQMETDETSENP